MNKIEKRPSKHLNRIIYWLLGITVPIVLCYIAYSNKNCSNPPGDFILLTLISLTVIAEKYVLKNKLKEKIFKLIILNILLLFYWINVAFFFQPRCPSMNPMQKETSTLIASYTKASQAYFSEYGELATSTKDIGQYVAIAGCQTTGSLCKKTPFVRYENSEITRWYSPTGNYEIEMKSENDQNIFIATPTGKFKKKGLGVSGCFNSKNGKTNILEMETRGTNVEIANCSD